MLGSRLCPPSASRWAVGGISSARSDGKHSGPRGAVGAAGEGGEGGRGLGSAAGQRCPWGQGSRQVTACRSHFGEGLRPAPPAQPTARTATRGRGADERRAALMPQRCGNFLRRGGAASHLLLRTRSGNAPRADRSIPRSPPRSPLVEVILGVVQPQTHGHRVALPALREDIIHRGCRCGERCVRARLCAVRGPLTPPGRRTAGGAAPPAATAAAGRKRPGARSVICRPALGAASRGERRGTAPEETPHRPAAPRPIGPPLPARPSAVRSRYRCRSSDPDDSGRAAPGPHRSGRGWGLRSAGSRRERPRCRGLPRRTPRPARGPRARCPPCPARRSRTAPGPAPPRSPLRRPRTPSPPLETRSSPRPSPPFALSARLDPASSSARPHGPARPPLPAPAAQGGGSAEQCVAPPRPPPAPPAGRAAPRRAEAPPGDTGRERRAGRGGAGRGTGGGRGRTGRGGARGVTGGATWALQFTLRTAGDALTSCGRGRSGLQCTWGRGAVGRSALLRSGPSAAPGRRDVRGGGVERGRGRPRAATGLAGASR